MFEPTLETAQYYFGEQKRASFESEESIVEELVLYTTNDGELYRQKAQPIIQNLKRKRDKGDYDHELAIKLWEYLAEAGAQKYAQEFGSPDIPWHQMFPKNIRDSVAREFADHYMEELEQETE